MSKQPETDTPPEVVNSQAEPKKSDKQVWALVGPLAVAFAIVVSAAVAAAYQFGEGVVYINDQTISDMSFFEVTGGTALGILGALVGVVAAAIGAVAALIATIVGISLGAVGLIGTAIVVAGIVTGPILLVTIIAVLIKRHYWPDVI